MSGITIDMGVDVDEKLHIYEINPIELSNLESFGESKYDFHSNYQAKLEGLFRGELAGSHYIQLSTQFESADVLISHRYISKSGEWVKDEMSLDLNDDQLFDLIIAIASQAKTHPIILSCDLKFRTGHEFEERNQRFQGLLYQLKHDAPAGFTLSDISSAQFHPMANDKAIFADVFDDCDQVPRTCIVSEEINFDSIAAFLDGLSEDKVVIKDSLGVSSEGVEVFNKVDLIPFLKTIQNKTCTNPYWQNFGETFSSFVIQECKPGAVRTHLRTGRTAVPKTRIALGFHPVKLDVIEYKAERTYASIASDEVGASDTARIISQNPAGGGVDDLVDDVDATRYLTALQRGFLAKFSASLFIEDDKPEKPIDLSFGKAHERLCGASSTLSESDISSLTSLVLDNDSADDKGASVVGAKRRRKLPFAEASAVSVDSADRGAGAGSEYPG